MAKRATASQKTTIRQGIESGEFLPKNIDPKYPLMMMVSAYEGLHRFRSALFLAYDLNDHPKRHLAFDTAWSLGIYRRGGGAEGGLYDVLNYMDDVVALLE